MGNGHFSCQLPLLLLQDLLHRVKIKENGKPRIASSTSLLLDRKLLNHWKQGGPGDDADGGAPGSKILPHHFRIGWVEGGVRSIGGLGRGSPKATAFYGLSSNAPLMRCGFSKRRVFESHVNATT